MGVNSCSLWTYMPRLRVSRGNTPRLSRKLESWPSAFEPFEADVAGWSLYGKGMALLLPPGLNRELCLLC